jgi:4a-hydroxytetrahydrobiopterin dehydratase
MWQEKDNSLYQKFSFKDFDEAFDFIGKVADIAREENHHPDIKNSYNTVELWLTTHSAGGVTEKDQKFVQKIDKILAKKSRKNSQRTRNS